MPHYQHYITVKNQEQLEAVAKYQFHIWVEFEHVEEEDGSVTQYFWSRKKLPQEDADTISELQGVEDWEFNERKD